MIDNDGSARLRKGGMIRAAIAAAALVVTAAPMTANAAVVYVSGGISSAGGSTTVSFGGTPLFDLVRNYNKGTAAVLGNFANSFAYIGAPSGRVNLNDITRLSVGDVVGGTSTFLTDGIACFHVTGNGYCGLFPPGTSGYFGFSFSPDLGVTTNYGYAEVEIAADGQSLTLLGGAYEDSGDGISVAPLPANDPIIDPPLGPEAEVPEPGTWATMLLAAGLLGFALRRRGPRAVLA